MNSVVLMGRLTRNPETRYSQGTNPMAVTRYTLAVDRRFKREGEQNADFIPCIAFGKAGEFADKYFKQGTKVVVRGRIQTGSYKNRDGNTVYTTDIVVEEQEFAESKANQTGGNNTYPNPGTANANEAPKAPAKDDGFMKIPEGFDEELPFI